MKLRILSSFLAMGLLGAATLISAQTTMTGQLPPDALQQQRGYLIGPGDVIDVKVLGEDQFSFSATVDDDGKVEPPFTDKAVYVKCRTERELRPEMAKALTRYLKNPQVSVQVKEKKSRPAAIINGAVRTPSQVTLNRRTQLIELINFAGGPTEDASNTVQVFHTTPVMCPAPGEEIQATTATNGEIPIEIYKLSDLKNANSTNNPWINPGDIVIIPNSPPVYITGEVRNPQGIRFREELTLTTALGIVSGINPKAKTKDVKIYRVKADSTEREIISVNYDLIKKGQQKDVLLKPYDIVVVDKAPKSAKEYLLDFITRGAEGVTSGIGALPTRVLY